METNSEGFAENHRCYTVILFWIFSIYFSKLAMAFIGKYERTSADNYDEFLKALDVNFLLRKAATVSTPVMEVSEAGGFWTIKTSTTLKTMELKFELGKEFEETTADGRDVKAIVTQEGNKFISIQTAKKEGEKSTRVVCEFTDTEVIQTMEVIGTEQTSSASRNSRGCKISTTYATFLLQNLCFVVTLLWFVFHLLAANSMLIWLPGFY